MNKTDIFFFSCRNDGNEQYFLLQIQQSSQSAQIWKQNKTLQLFPWSHRQSCPLQRSIDPPKKPKANNRRIAPTFHKPQNILLSLQKMRHLLIILKDANVRNEKTGLPQIKQIRPMGQNNLQRQLKQKLRSSYHIVSLSITTSRITSSHSINIGTTLKYTC